MPYQVLFLSKCVIIDGNNFQICEKKDRSNNTNDIVIAVTIAITII